jgi:DNA-binding response OmpR family regulator
MLKVVLEQNGFIVNYYHKPIIALDEFKSNFYNLIILDIQMSDINGMQLYTTIREKDHRVKICFLTAITTFNEDFRQTRMTLGKTITEDYFIQKTIKNEDLIKKLTSIMNLK